MKNLFCSLLLLAALQSQAQITTVTLKPHFADGIEGTLYTIDSTSPYWVGNPNQYVTDNNYYGYPDFCYNGDLSNYDTTRLRHIIRFSKLNDTAIIPDNAIIDFAMLHLYGVPHSDYGNWGNTYFVGSPWAAAGPNDGWVYELTDSFNAHTVTWRNAPGWMHTDSVALHASLARWDEDDSADVTNMVRDMHAHINTGFLIKIKDEHYGKERLFGSCFYSDSSRHPSLTVRYHMPVASLNNVGNIHASISIYPNPAVNVIYLSADGHSVRRCLINIYNTVGKQVLTNIVDDLTDDTPIDISHVTPGLYICEMVSGTSVIRKQFIKQ